MGTADDESDVDDVMSGNKGIGEEWLVVRSMISGVEGMAITPSIGCSRCRGAGFSASVGVGRW